MLRDKQGALHTINETHRSFDALHFVLLMPRGDNGWTPKMLRFKTPRRYPVFDDEGVLYGQFDPWSGCWRNDEGHASEPDPMVSKNNTSKHQLSVRQFYAHRICQRGKGSGVEPHIRAGRLFQEYVCVNAAKVSSERLRYIETHQADIRADLYQNIADAARSGTECGKRVVLPASYAGERVLARRICRRFTEHTRTHRVRGRRPTRQPQPVQRCDGNRKEKRKAAILHNRTQTHNYCNHVDRTRTGHVYIRKGVRKITQSTTPACHIHHIEYMYTYG